MPKSQGFTLIEILVAITIIALVAVVAIPNYHAFQKRQTVQNYAKQLAATIKLVQNNARTGTKCPDPTYTEPKDWDIILNSPQAQCGAAPNSFQITALCFNPNGQYNLSLSSWAPNSGIQQVWPQNTITQLPPGLTISFNYPPGTGTCSSPNGDIWMTNAIEFYSLNVLNWCGASPTANFCSDWTSQPTPGNPYNITISDGTYSNTVSIDSYGNITTQ